MSGKSDNGTLDAARSRLEAALSRLAQGAASSKKAMDSAKLLAAEKAEVVHKVSTLESENLSLHEKVRDLSMQSPEPIDSTELDQLHQQISELHHANEKLMDRNIYLEGELEELHLEKDAIKERLDTAIRKLEELLGSDS